MQLLAYVDAVPGMDAEYCPDPLPKAARWWMVYAGGSSAAHAWEADELARVAHLPRLPVWVPTPGLDDPHTAASQFISWLQGHGVPALSQATGERTRVMWDMERGKQPDPAWLDVAADALRAAGYRSLVYGSLDTLLQQPARAGYVVANPTRQAHLYQHPYVVATQYDDDVPVTGGRVDLDVATSQLVRQLWLPEG